MRTALILSRNIILFVCLLQTACDKISLPKSDSTPPVLSWNVLNLNTNKSVDHSGNPIINAKVGEKYRITLKAIDKDGGIKSISLGGAIEWACFSHGGGEDLGQSHFADLNTDTQNLHPDGDGKVLTSIILIKDIDLNLGCSGNFKLNGGDATLIGKAHNYHSGVANSTLKFKVFK